MSHFTVLVINSKGENDVEKQLEPYWELDLTPEDAKEDPRAVFNDETDNYRKEYEENTRKEFYCNSSCSYGYEMPKQLREIFSGMKEGQIKKIDIDKGSGIGMSYLKLGERYGVYDFKYDEESKREVPISDSRQWFEVEEIVETSHPDPTVCFEGVVKIRKIAPPKEIPLKDSYGSFEEFCEDWHSAEPNENGRYGYYRNPNAKWDWFDIGGRWAGKLRLKENVEKELEPNFSWGWDEKEKIEVLSQPVTDQARKVDIDWKAMETNSEEFEKNCRFWELKVEGAEPQNKEEEDILKWDFYNEEYYKNKYKNKKTYVRAQMSFSTYAVLKDGEWMGKGEMGWFGMSDENDEEAVEWESNFYERFIKDLPDEALITVVDCHI